MFCYTHNPQPLGEKKMSVFEKIVKHIDELLPLAEAWASSTPSKTDDFVVGIVRNALELLKRRVLKSAPKV